MYLTILTPDKLIFSGKIKTLRLPGYNKPFTVLKNHASLITLLSEGEISFITDADVDFAFTLNLGLVEVKRNNITLLAEKITQAE